jgi:hypothetical protein
MDRTDLIDTAFEVTGDNSQANQVGAVRTVRAAVIDGEKPVAQTAGRHRMPFLKDGKPPVPVPLTAVTDAIVTRTGLDGDALTAVTLTG